MCMCAKCSVLMSATALVHYGDDACLCAARALCCMSPCGFVQIVYFNDFAVDCVRCCCSFAFHRQILAAKSVALVTSAHCHRCLKQSSQADSTIIMQRLHRTQLREFSCSCSLSVKMRTHDGLERASQASLCSLRQASVAASAVSTALETRNLCTLHRFPVRLLQITAAARSWLRPPHAD